MRPISRACLAGGGDPLLSRPRILRDLLCYHLLPPLLSHTLHSCPGALRLLFSLWHVLPFSGFLFFLLPSFTLVFRQLLREAPYLKSQGLLTSPVTLTFLFLNCCPPTTLHVCMCVCVCTAEWPPPHGAVQCKYVWMTSLAPSFLSVYNFKKIYLQKYDGHFITFIRSTMDQERR